MIEHPHYPGIYVTRDGVIKWTDSRGRHNSSRGVKFRKHKPYRIVRIKYNGKLIRIRVHRAVALCYIDNPHNYPQVNHIDGDHGNNNADNLEWCTNSMNAYHRDNVISHQHTGKTVHRVMINATGEIITTNNLTSMCRAFNVRRRILLWRRNHPNTPTRKYHPLTLL